MPRNPAAVARRAGRVSPPRKVERQPDRYRDDQALQGSAPALTDVLRHVPCSPTRSVAAQSGGQGAALGSPRRQVPKFKPAEAETGFPTPPAGHDHGAPGRRKPSTQLMPLLAPLSRCPAAHHQARHDPRRSASGGSGALHHLRSRAGCGRAQCPRIGASGQTAARTRLKWLNTGPSRGMVRSAMRQTSGTVSWPRGP